MMLSRWDALSARISGIADSANLLAQFLQAKNSDAHGVHRALGIACSGTFDALGQFYSDLKLDLPPPILARLDVLFSQADLFSAARTDAPSARAAAMLLVALKSEVSFYLADEQEQIRSLTERAFLHLRRILVVDQRTRDDWRMAFTKGEVSCEKLGSIHLLWHGIFAFKVDAVGARTDLIYPEPPDARSLASTASGLVLTEWKVATPKTASTQFSAAFKQAQLYTDGPLSALELKRFRYLVVVSEQELPSSLVPPDLDTGSVVYRHINLPIAPNVPSVSAAKDVREARRAARVET